MAIIPELAVSDPATARQTLCDVFGFSEDGPHLRFGDQVITIVSGTGVGHGVIDHLALAVPDLEGAAAAMMARGARMDRDVTPDGPRTIAEFWGAGVRYLFLQGPQGARIELIQNLGAPRPAGHDHIGIPCSDIGASQRFFQALGARQMASVALQRPEGETQVRFLALGASVLELYQPPGHVAPSAQGMWRRLLIAGASPAAGTVPGPDGLLIAPL